MAHVWKNPENGFVKLNVHFTELEEPNHLGNSNGLGIILRNEQGSKLWGALGPVRGMSELSAIIWGAQAGVLAALSMNMHKIQIETDNREAYDTIRVQEFIILPPDLEEAFSQFNTLFANQFQENLTVRQISIIPVELNGTAQYMASYGMERLDALVLAPSSFGNIQHYLDRDMGRAMPYPEFELQDNLGEGEVIDPSPPLSPAKCYQLIPTGQFASLNLYQGMDDFYDAQTHFHVDMGKHASGTAERGESSKKNKGKEKVYQ